MKEYSDSFVGFVLPTKAGKMFMDDVRKVLKNSGFRLTVHGRNPDRKQFYKNEKRLLHKYVDCGVERVYTPKHQFCQDLPLKFATSYALYLRSINGQMGWDARYNRSLAKAVGMVEALRKVYVNSVKNAFPS